MSFKGFTQADFETFHIDGLDERMAAIRKRIQPKFKAIGDELADYLTEKAGHDMYIHIAKHARRTVNPPNDTWMAFSYNKRGYKKHPHFQIGLWDDRVFVWLAYIYELPNKQAYARTFLEHEETLADIIPQDYDVSMNHMKKSNEKWADIHLREKLERFLKVKSAEFLVGKQFAMGDPILQDGEAFINEVKAIYDTLIPVYQLSLGEKK
ncbi:uncharacterized protein YktB (UPF0637 family) [Cerasibacillus quisquiliarum]|uniref:UPF0637 protein CQU01_23640 n=1 Tax=Cerasibacillus quisquiliarum TaxID=227865 RepID=A0A511UZQ2_9BACI|nr:DUF1054 domain-containing protein [Cerasibacillus quisquiliarum]MBB5147305.1 uncharacterized protein YktB (UPF0637 family) [Cerasibacillus quisquiliarum]GEN32126.1 UPF0637 protein [Cerasibacillus quisquiliarum]